MRLAWATDIHLDHCEPETIAAFIAELAAEDADAYCLTGDLSEAPQLEPHLTLLAEKLQKPIYFVLGNHDYYHGSISAVRERMRSLSAASPWLRWMPAAGIVPLSSATAILGHDAWGDGRNGDVHGTWVKLTDFRLIEDFVTAGEAGRVALLNRLGDEAADYLRPLLARALADYSEVILLMHPPPLREACLYGSEVADDNWAPHFTCKAVGDLILALLPQYPDRQLTVLAGHTHNICDIRPHPNLRLCVGAAAYARPTLAQLFEFA